MNRCSHKVRVMYQQNKHLLPVFLNNNDFHQEIEDLDLDCGV